MTLSDEERELLIKYRMEQADEAIEEARFLIQYDKLKLAANRIYYGMFYILASLALKHGFKTSKHKELIGWFNKNFIKEKILDQRYGEVIRKAFNKRSDSDYGIMVKFEKSEIEKMFTDMTAFIAAVKGIL